MSKKAGEKTGAAGKKCKYSLIENNITRNNTKCKRKSNLFKKSMQLATLCGQDILLIIYDQEFQKIYQYKSSEQFDVERAKDLLNQGAKQNEGVGGNRGKRKQQAAIKIYDYSNKDLKKFAKDDDVGNEDGEDEDDQNDMNEGSDTPPKNQSSLFGSNKRMHSEMEKQKNMAVGGNERQVLEKVQKMDCDTVKLKQACKKIQMPKKDIQGKHLGGKIALDQKQSQAKLRNDLESAYIQNQQNEEAPNEVDSIMESSDLEEVERKKYEASALYQKEPQGQGNSQPSMSLKMQGAPQAEPKQQLSLSFKASISRESNIQRLNGVNTVDSKMLFKQATRPDGLKSCLNPIQIGVEKAVANQRQFNFGSNIVFKEQQNQNMIKPQLSVSDFVKSKAAMQQNKRECKSPFNLKNGALSSLTSPMPLKSSTFHNFFQGRINTNNLHLQPQQTTSVSFNKKEIQPNVPSALHAKRHQYLNLKETLFQKPGQVSAGLDNKQQESGQTSARQNGQTLTNVIFKAGQQAMRAISPTASNNFGSGTTKLKPDDVRIRNKNLRLGNFAQNNLNISIPGQKKTDKCNQLMHLMRDNDFFKRYEFTSQMSLTPLDNSKQYLGQNYNSQLSQQIATPVVKKQKKDQDELQ